MIQAHVGHVLVVIRKAAEAHQRNDQATRQLVVELHREGQAIPADQAAQLRHQEPVNGG